MGSLRLPIATAFRWVGCPGSAQLESQMPRDENEHHQSREEGKAADWLAEQMITAMQGQDQSVTLGLDVIGTLAPNNIVIDPQMFEGVREYVNDIFRVANAGGLLRSVEVQRRVDMSWYNIDQYGYIDACIIDRDKKRITVWDLKYGHRVVEAFENWQLVGYAQSLMIELGLNGIDDQEWTLDLRIVQPRGYHRDGIVRAWQLRAVELRGYVNQIKHAADIARMPEALCKPGVGRCDNCAGRHDCEALTHACYALIDYSYTPQPLDMSVDAKSVELRVLRAGEKLIKARLSGMESSTLADISQGVAVPGFAAEQGYGRETWQKGVDLDEVELMADMMGIDCRKPREIDTPAQLRNKGIDADVIKQYSYRPKCKVKLVEDDGSKARQVFGRK